jgi:hypothetical protein
MIYFQYQTLCANPHQLHRYGLTYNRQHQKNGATVYSKSSIGLNIHHRIFAYELWGSISKLAIVASYMREVWKALIGARFRDCKLTLNFAQIHAIETARSPLSMSYHGATGNLSFQMVSLNIIDIRGTCCESRSKRMNVKQIRVGSRLHTRPANGSIPCTGALFW